MTNKNIEYKGYEIIGLQNNKIVAQIKNNLHKCKSDGFLGSYLFYEPPIRFKFSSYDVMTSFIDENPR